MKANEAKKLSQSVRDSDEPITSIYDEITKACQAGLNSTYIGQELAVKHHEQLIDDGYQLGILKPGSVHVLVSWEI